MAKPIPGHIGYYTVEPLFDPTDLSTIVRVLLDMSWWSRRLYKWRGFVSIGERQPKGFTAPVEFFFFECPNCGPVLTNPHGHDERIECTPCYLKALRSHPTTATSTETGIARAEEDTPEGVPDAS